MESIYMPDISLSNREIETRLNKMMVKYNPLIKERDYLRDKYTEALKDPLNVQWIANELEQDHKNKNIYSKRTKAISTEQYQNNKPHLFNEKMYKINPQQLNDLNNNNNDLNEIKKQVIKVKLSLKKKKQNKNEILQPKINENNLHVITPKNNENRFFIPPIETKDKQINVYQVINNNNNNNLQNEPTPMNYLTDLHNNININNKINQQHNQNDLGLLTNNTNQNVSKNNIKHVINNINITNINSKRQSLLQSKYQHPSKTRRTISNPKELTERSALFDSISDNYGDNNINNNNNKPNIIRRNSSNNFNFISPMNFYERKSPSPPRKEIVLSPKKIISFNKHSKDCYDFLIKAFTFVGCGFCIYLFIKNSKGILEKINNIIHNLFDSHETFTSFLKNLLKKVGSLGKAFLNKLKDIITKLFISSFKSVKVMFINNLYYILILCILGIALWFVYSKYKERKLIQKIFTEIKRELEELNELQDDNESEESHSFEHGIPEREIIKKYSKMYNIEETKFKTKYFPQLKQMRKTDLNLREYEVLLHGKRQIMWQYSI